MGPPHQGWAAEEGGRGEVERPWEWKGGWLVGDRRCNSPDRGGMNGMLNLLIESDAARPRTTIERRGERTKGWRTATDT